MKKTMLLNLKLIFALTIFLSVGNSMYAQQRKVTGNVISSDERMVLPGVNVVIKGTSRGTVTDFDGNFSLDVFTDNTVLVFSYVGFKSQEITLNSKSVINVSLIPDTSKLDEVVVIGYGTVKREDLTGAVSSIKTESLKNISAPTFENLLQGTASGVHVTSGDGTPGGAMNIQIRGAASVNASSEPLYVIDGFPVVMEDLEYDPSGGGIGASLSPLASINPADIESIDILKDASATAIYGARGANGVVLITTKSGKSGKTKVSYDSYVGFTKVSNKLDMMSQEEYLFMLKDVVGTSLSYIDPNTGDFFEKLKSPDAYIDWQDKIFREAITKNHQLSVSGGNDNSKFSISLGYFGNEGVIVGSEFERISGRLNFENKINDKIKVGTQLSHSNISYYGSFSGGGTANFGGVTYNALRYRPIIPENVDEYVEDDYGDFESLDALVGNTSNPVAFAYDLKREFNTNRSLFNAYAEMEVIDGLKLKVTGGVDLVNAQIDKFYPITTAYGRLYNGRADREDTNTTTFLNENTLSYAKRLKSHTIRALAGFTVQKYRRKGIYNRVHGFPIETNSFYDLSAGLDPQTPQTPFNEWSMASLISRINYDYKGKYYFTASYRRDGSSRFGADNKWAGFPSAAVAWNVAREDFIKSVEQIDQLKIRASYGKTGNQNIASYRSLESLTGVNYPFGESLSAGVINGVIGNPDLKWETTGQYDIGIDLGLFDSQVKITADWFKKETSDMLLSVTLPSSSGYTSALQNFGSIEQSGYEFSIGTQIVNKNDFSWNANFNISFLKNEVLELGEADEILIGGGSSFSVNLVREGQPLGVFYGLEWIGNYQLEDFDYDVNLAHEDRTYTLKDGVASTVGYQSTQQPGDIKFKDISGPSGVPDGIVDENDRQIIGDPNPKHFGGLLNNFKYKNFDLSVYMNWSYGNDIYNWQKYNFGMPGLTTTQNYFSEVVNFWSIDNQNNEIPRLEQGGKARTGNYGNSYSVEDGSFLRLNNVTLGYTLPNSVSNKLNITSLRFYVSADNLHVWTKYSGYDPEVSLSRNQLARGQDSSPYPRSKGIRLGVNVNF